MIFQLFKQFNRWVIVFSCSRSNKLRSALAHTISFEERREQEKGVSPLNSWTPAFSQTEWNIEGQQNQQGCITPPNLWKFCGPIFVRLRPLFSQNFLRAIRDHFLAAKLEIKQLNQQERPASVWPVKTEDLEEVVFSDIFPSRILKLQTFSRYLLASWLQLTISGPDVRTQLP